MISNERDLTVDNLSVRTGQFQIVRGVSFHVERGEMLAIAGESGSGKSITCLAALRLLPDNLVAEGSLVFRDQHIEALDEEALRSFHASQARMIFQDPWSALNPVMTVGAQLMESARSARPRTTAEARATTIEALNLVGVSDPERRMSAYPSEMSGGILQRIVIAMAVLAEPVLLICDEPTTALDVTTETQIMELIKELNGKLGTSVILTTHDMGLIEEYCDRIIIMYAGGIVETGTVSACFTAPKHPYTRSLLAAVPDPGLVEPMTDLPTVEGTPPAPRDIGAGCSFAPRCPHRMEKCAVQPPLVKTDTQGGMAACWLLEEIAA